MSNILMNGTEPIGQVGDLTADNVEYSAGVSVKDKLDSKTDYIGNITSITEGLISCGDNQTVSYTTTEKGWYRLILVNTNNSDVSVRINLKSFAYSNMTSRFEMVIPLSANVDVQAQVVGTGHIYLNKFNF